MKCLLKYLSLLVVSCGVLYGQTSPRNFKEARIKNKQAPAYVKNYIHTLDSLIDLGQRRWVNKTWSDHEAKRYASMLYDLYEYDPVLRKMHNYDPETVDKYKGRGWLIGDRTILEEAEQRLPKLEARLISVALWLVVNVDSVSAPRKYSAEPGIPFTENRVYGRISKVWKGLQYCVGQHIECYYMKEWGDPGIKPGMEYLLLLDPVMDYQREKFNELSIGGFAIPSTIEEYVFPVANGTIMDRRKLFGMGERLDLNNFNKYLTYQISEIKSWKLKTD